MKYRRILAVAMFLLAAGAVVVAVYLWSRPTASVSWQIESLVVAETESPVGLTVELSETVSETVTVELDLRGTVRPGRYSVSSAVLTIPPGQLLATTSLSLTSNGQRPGRRGDHRRDRRCRERRHRRQRRADDLHRGHRRRARRDSRSHQHPAGASDVEHLRHFAFHLGAHLHHHGGRRAGTVLG